ncbi:hypothetical protein O0L34_g4332 [Tuta absoluta]|nr:hypothetical protein O0L34_g4332 [Tuta absoluta]
MPKPYPERFQLTASGGYQVHPEKSSYLRSGLKAGPPTVSKMEGWRSRTFVSGKSCFDRFSKQKKMAFFYDERFEVNADPPGKLNIFMKIYATWDVTIQCVKLTLPNHLQEPIIRGVRESNVSVEFVSNWFPYTFYFSLGLYGRNSTAWERETWLDWFYYGRS